MKAGDSGAPGAWQSTAWRLERGFPDSFARPEIQLGVQVNQTTNNNTLVITVEQAEGLQKRTKAMEEEVDKLSEAYLARRGLASGTSRDKTREVEASLVLDTTITLPPGERHPNWWSALSRGDGTRPVEPAAAQCVIKTIAADTLGAARAARVQISLDDGSITLRDVWDAIASVCGPAGWQQLCRRGES